MYKLKKHKLTKKEAIKLFREHWRHLADTGMEDKKYFLKQKNHYSVLVNCYLCEYSGETNTWYGIKIRCNRCPIEWPKTHTGFCGQNPCTMSFYKDWCESNSEAERKSFADIISNLSEKKRTNIFLTILKFFGFHKK